MKQCGKCKQLKSLDQFAWKNKALNKKASECKACHKLWRESYYERNKQKEINRTAKRRNENKLWLKELKSSLRCERCSENHVATLCFHHKDPSIKEIAVAKATANGWSKTRILNEIKKCEVLCANCHAKEHWS